jgi:hypothetical protein
VLVGLGALVLLGGVRGPALLSPFFTVTLASNAGSRGRALRRPFARTGLVLVALVPALTGVLAWTLVRGAGLPPTSATLLVVAAAGVALLGHALWLGAQAADARTRRVLAGVLAALAVAVAVLPLPPLGPPAVVAIALLGIGVLAEVLALHALDSLRGTVLLEQALRWESAVGIATSADLAGAAGTFRSLPRAGRRLRAVAGGGVSRTARVVLYVRRDLVCLLRTPERLVIGSLAALAAPAVIVRATAALTAGADTVAPVPTIVLPLFAVAAGSVALYLAGGVFADGIRHAVATLGAPRLFGQGIGTQLAAHAVAPTVILLVLASGGALVVGAMADVPTGAAAVLPVILLVPVIVLIRVRDAAKGPMPLRLATPIPTAQGDASVIPMLVWQADALLLSAVCGCLFAAAELAGPSALPGVALACAAVVASGARSRVRDLGSVRDRAARRARR